LRRTAILADPHFGFVRDNGGILTAMHDERALAVAHQVCKAAKVDQVAWLGDMLDLPEWSDKFLRSPGFYFTTQPAIEAAHSWILRFRELAPSEILEGNHDKRLETMVMSHMLQAYQLKPVGVDMPAMSVPFLLQLDAIDVSYVGDYPNGEIWLNNRLKAIHGDTARGGSGDTAKAIASNSMVSTVFGHIHRLESATRTIYQRNGTRTVMAISPGCLCRVDGLVPGQKRKQNWQQGMAIVDHDEDELFGVTLVPIVEGRAVYDGVVYVSV